jgi:hypothetical protein
LLLVNERLENALQRLNAKLADCQPYRLQLLH